MGENMHHITRNDFNFTVNFFNRDEVPEIFTLPKSFNDRAESQSYPFWMTIFSGVAVVIAALLHAAFWKPFSMFFGAIVSAQTAFA